MLARARFSDDARLAHAPGEKDLAERVVDLVAAGMIQFVALEVDARPAESRSQPLGEPQGTRTAHVVTEQPVQLRLEGGVRFRRLIGLLDIQDERHKGLGDEAAAEPAEAAACVGTGAQGIRPRESGLTQG